MSETRKSITDKIGLSPGTLLHIGTRKTDKVHVTLIKYNEHEIIETVPKTIENLVPENDKYVHWINVEGLHDIPVISAIGNQFNLHPLLLEDILNTQRRPSAEDFGDHLSIFLSILVISEDKERVEAEQLSIILGSNWVLTFHEGRDNEYKGLMKRLREGVGNIRKSGADYLLYAIIDTVVDNYFLITEHISDSIEVLEEKILREADKEAIENLQRLKRELIGFRKRIPPLREAVNFLQKETNTLIKRKTTQYMRDVYEHIIQVNETIETQKEMLASVLELYNSIVSNKMNQIMKVLTIISTFFIPLTFLAGIYGMNFEFMPELGWHYGYFIIWGVMGIISILMVAFFRRKNWF